MSLSLFKVFMNDNIEKDIIPVLKSGFITQGKKVEEFETQLQNYFDYPYILTLNSATSGLTLALKMMNLPENSEVLICPLTCFATTTAILANNLKIKWVDVDYNTCNIDLDDLKNKITLTTRAILFVHWAGMPVDLNKIEEIKEYTKNNFDFEIKVLEDCAHSFGAKYNDKFIGTHGNYAVFSLQAIKHLTTGDGGLIFLPNKEEYERAKLLRWYGIDRNKRNVGKDFRLENDIIESGYKYHMNDINATIGLSNLPFMNLNLEIIRDNAEYYNNELKNINGIQLLKSLYNSLPSYWLYTIKVQNKLKFIEYMKSKDIMVSQVHQRNDINSCVKEYQIKLPNLDKMEKEMVCIPVGWYISEQDREYIVNCIKEFYN